MVINKFAQRPGYLLSGGAAASWGEVCPSGAVLRTQRERTAGVGGATAAHVIAGVVVTDAVPTFLSATSGGVT